MAFATIVLIKFKKKQMLSPDSSPYTDKTLHSFELAVKNSHPISKSHVDPFNFTS